MRKSHPYIGRTIIGKTKADATKRARSTYKIPKTVKLHLEFQFSDPPYKVYEIQKEK